MTEYHIIKTNLHFIFQGDNVSIIFVGGKVSQRNVDRFHVRVM